MTTLRDQLTIRAAKSRDLDREAEIYNAGIA